jgi:hypothetical protein
MIGKMVSKLNLTWNFQEKLVSVTLIGLVKLNVEVMVLPLFYNHLEPELKELLDQVLDIRELIMSSLLNSILSIMLRVMILLLQFKDTFQLSLEMDKHLPMNRILLLGMTILSISNLVNLKDISIILNSKLDIWMINYQYM